MKRVAPNRSKPEIMSPAGYWPQLQAAVEAGADSVYFGLKQVFTARAKVGFSIAEIPEVFRTLHRRGVRGFVTFNTLVFDHEMREAARTIARLAEAGADALIIQDIGVLRLAREVAPDLELHASTQMSITDAPGAALAAEMGVRRVTLARELSLVEIRAIREQVDVELEVFVHGALCVAYSGQCFSSEAWGGRSANRGQCAQACRLPYDLFVDGAPKSLGDARYLLSPGDLYALHHIAALTEAGIQAFKIEGRYKEAEYVAAATKAYRQALDDAWTGRALSVTPREELDLEQIYSRGPGDFFVSGTNHQRVVEGRAPRHRGVRVGEVRRIEAGAVIIEPTSANRLSPLKPGDGVVFDAAAWRSPEEPEEGGRAYGVVGQRDGTLEVRFAHGAIDFARIRPGDLLWRTDDPALAASLRPYLEPATPVARQPVEVEVFADAGKPLVAVWRLVRKPEIEARVESPEPLAPALNRSLDEAALRGQFERLGNTSYSLASLVLNSGGPAFAPVSLLNQLRREAVESLERRQSAALSVILSDPLETADRLLDAVAAQPAEIPPQMHLLVRAPDQLSAALELAPASITLDYLELYGLKPSVELVREAGIAVRVATPRILKPGEERVIEFLLRLECPLLIRPAGLLHALRGQPARELTGDFSLNAANALSARLLLEQGLARLTPTHDLNGEQVARLALETGAARLEVIAYQHLPVFHTEHCVFCRFLSQGTTYKDCGRPCEIHRITIGDVNGRRHPVIADVGCRNTVFGAEAQEASAFLGRWLDAGIRHFRLEFVHESAEELSSITRAFRSALAGDVTFRQLAEILRRAAPQGSTQGSLFVPAGFPELPVLP